MGKTVERKMDLKTSIDNAMSIYEKEGLEFTIEKTCLLPDVFTTSVYVEEKTSKFATQGNGKGVGQQSLASALYEGLEHYFSERYDYEGNSISVALKDVINQSQKLKIEAPLYEMFEIDSTLTLKCMVCNALNGKSELWYPSFLMFPSVKDVSQEFLCYSSNNGIAVGTDQNEALLHSICELVERNAVSKTMMGLLRFPKQKLKRIKIPSIPSNLREIISAFEAQQGSIIIYDISIMEQFPVYMTVLNSKKTELPICGYGCSLSPRYALERSILECLQCAHLYSSCEKMEDASVLRFFSASKEITDMLLLHNVRIIESEFSDITINMSVDKMLEYVAEVLGKQGYEVYYKVLYELDTFCCVKALIPGFEKFHLIRSGCPVCANKKLK